MPQTIALTPEVIALLKALMSESALPPPTELAPPQTLELADKLNEPEPDIADTEEASELPVDTPSEAMIAAISGAPKKKSPFPPKGVK